MEFQKLKVLNFSCVRSLDWKVSLEKNIPPGTMIAENILYEENILFLHLYCNLQYIFNSCNMFVI